MIRMGITGGIGSGKTTVAQLIERASNGVVLDADAISRQTTAAGGAALPELARILGPEILAKDGGMNRPWVRQRAFEDPAFRHALESIIHPLVQREMARIETDCLSRQVPVLIYDIPLLVESGRWRPVLDRILVVDCSESTQIDRVAARSGLDADEVRAIIRAQAERNYRLASADMVLCNDGISLAQLEKHSLQVSNILLLSNLAKDSA